MKTAPVLLTEHLRSFAAWMFGVPVMKITVGEYDGVMYVKEILGSAPGQERPLCRLTEMKLIASLNQRRMLADTIEAANETFDARAKRMAMKDCSISVIERKEVDAIEILVMRFQHRWSRSIALVAGEELMEHAKALALSDIEVEMIRRGAFA